MEVPRSEDRVKARLNESAFPRKNKLEREIALLRERLSKHEQALAQERDLALEHDLVLELERESVPLHKRELYRERELYSERHFLEREHEIVLLRHRLGELHAITRLELARAVAQERDLKLRELERERRFQLHVERNPLDIPAELERPRRWKRFQADTVGEAVERIIPYLEDTSEANKVIYFDGWRGLAASKVLKAIAEDPPPSLRNKFEKIVHVDCSRWKNQRALQKEIAHKLELQQAVMTIFDRQDEEDDFNGVDQGSRVEIRDVGKAIHQALQGHNCLVVFHNGGNNMVDLNYFGIPMSDRWSNRVSKILWTFRGRLNPIKEMKQETEPQPSDSEVESIEPDDKPLAEGVGNSHIYLQSYFKPDDPRNVKSYWMDMLREEARDIVQYTHTVDVNQEIATKCCLYMLALNSKNGDMMDYNWAAHASNYWVCDGIIQEGQEDKAWEVGAILHQEIRLDDYSSHRLPTFGDKLDTPPNRWVSQVTDSSVPTIQPELSSFFFSSIVSLPNNMFQQSENLRVLKLCRCTFNFYSPPFHRCRSLRFLGLDDCHDQPQKEGREKQDRSAMECFQSLWVLDICCTDWELDLFPSTIEQMATNVREVHIKKGCIWHSNLAWRRLQNLRKLRVIEPTCSWQTGNMDEFTDMVRLEHLNLSGNSTINVLPSLSGATGLKTLVLDGCVGLEHIGPDSLPPVLESFSLDASKVSFNSKAKITRISMAGCTRLADFTLRGSLPELEELDISGTSVKTLILQDQVVQAPRLQQIILLGCEQLRSILWPEKGIPLLRVLCIDTQGEEVRKRSHDSFIRQFPQEYCHAYVSVMDMRFIQLLVLRSSEGFCWDNNRFNLKLCMSCTSKDKDPINNKEKSIIPNASYYTCTDAVVDNTISDTDETTQFQPMGCHVEIAEGISNTNMESITGIKAIIFVMNKVESLHVHDNSSITTVIPDNMMSTGKKTIYWSHLKRCLVERCPKLDNVFATNYDKSCFEQLETFSAVDLLITCCIWSKGRIATLEDTKSFAQLRSIHLYSCPRLKFVLPLSWFYTLSKLETLHIVYCGDLRQVFPVEEKFLARIATDNRKGVLGFPNLKHIYLHELPMLQQICEAKMFAPQLEMVNIRGCWSLRRLPVVNRLCHPVVDCEKDWWEKLEWDGLETGHHSSLFKPRHSLYYKKALPKASVLQ